MKANPPKSIFEKQKKWRNEDVSLLFTLLCQQKLFTQNRRFSSHLHQAPEKTYLWSRSQWSLVKTFASLICEVAAWWRVDVFPQSAPAMLKRRRGRLDFFCHLLIYLKKTSLLLFCKTRWFKKTLQHFHQYLRNTLRLWHLILIILFIEKVVLVLTNRYFCIKFIPCLLFFTCACWNIKDRDSFVFQLF